jgi:hypothetical protein
MHAGLLKMVAAAASPITLCWEMSGQKERRQPELFVVVSRCEFLSDDHNLVRVDRVLDLRWLVKMSRLSTTQTRSAWHRSGSCSALNLAIRWFAGYALHEAFA